MARRTESDQRDLALFLAGVLYGSRGATRATVEKALKHISHLGIAERQILVALLTQDTDAAIRWFAERGAVIDEKTKAVEACGKALARGYRDSEVRKLEFSRLLEFSDAVKAAEAIIKLKEIE